MSEWMNEYIDRKNIVNVVINGNLYTNDWMNEYIAKWQGCENLEGKSLCHELCRGWRWEKRV